jgi:hypothetical protein
MPRITSIAARFSGVIAYTDNTHGQFHTQSDVLIWSQDQADSIENLKQASYFFIPGVGYPYWVGIMIGLSSLGFMNFEWDSPPPDVQKAINSIAGRFDFIVAFDDNTTSYAALSASGPFIWGHMPDDTVMIAAPEIAAASNIAEIRTQLTTMFLEIMDEVIITA